MYNFGRVLRLSLKYRLSCAGILVSSLVVAALWGANLGTIYPIVEVVLKGRSLHQWSDDNIRQAEQNRQSLRTQLAELPAEPSGSVARRKSSLQAELESTEQSLRYAQRLQPWISRYMPAAPFPTLVLVVGFLLVGTLIKSLFLFINVYLVERVTQLVAFDLRKLLYRRTLQMDLASFSEDRTASLISRFTHDMEGITEGVKTILGRTIREPLKIIVCLIGASLVCWRLLLFCLIVTPVASLLINRLSRSVKRANRRAMGEMALLYQQLSESLRGIQAVKAFTREQKERQRFHQFGKQYVKRAQRIAQYNVLTRCSTELMSIGVVSLALLAGGYLVLNHETHLLGLRLCSRPLSFGSLLAFFALLAGVSDPFRKLAEVYNQIQRGEAAADRIFELADREPTIRSQRNPVALPRPLAGLKVEGVQFAYDAGRTILQDIDFELPAKSSLAIVGPNGCGKSTLIKLLPRFYDPTAGAITWNGIDLRQLDLKQLRRSIGMVTQQTILFDDSVMNNIRYGAPHATAREAIEAAQMAHAHSFIESLPDGYDSMIGEGGGKLSGGQRQRIALARAILRNPELLILDEATSQIDIESEQLIHQALQTLVRGRTTIMITHRLSTLALADRILVMHAGRIEDFGTHEELIDRCPTYQHLHQLVAVHS